MGLLALARKTEPEPEVEERSGILPRFIVEGGVMGGSFGQAAVPIDRALRNAAFWACVDVLAGTVSATPLDVVRYQGTARRPMTPPPIISNPSAIVTQDVWLYQLTESLLTDGNAFGNIVGWDGNGRPQQIELINPADVTDRKVVNGKAQAKINGRTQDLWPHGDVWHMPGKYVRAGSPFGLSPMEYAAGPLRAGLAAEDYGSKYFTDGAHPTTMVRSKTKNLAQDAAQAIKDAFRRATVGNREPVVVGDDLEVSKIQTDPAETQYIDLLRFEIEQVCRYFRVPPSMVYAAVSGQSVTYANVSQADLAYLKYSLDGYLVRIERALSDLIARPQVVKFNRKAILRADAETRYKIHEIRLRNKLATVNDVKADEDEEPFVGDEYDTPGVPGGAPMPFPPTQGGN